MDGAELLAVWPMSGLRVRTPLLELRHATDDDLVDLMARNGDVHDPSTASSSSATRLPSPPRRLILTSGARWRCGRRAPACRAPGGWYRPRR